MANLDLSKYGIKDVKEIIHNPSYDVLFAEEIVYFAHINSNHIKKIINFAETNSILNQYVAEIRDVQVQSDRLRFRRNIERIGEIMAYEMSKDFAYSQKNIQTPLGIAPVQTPDNQLVLSTILRAICNIQFADIVMEL